MSTPPSIESLDPRQHILIKGARANNLKGIDVAIPRNKLVVVTGVSGSGKSSLAFDTLFAEGQRMYVESLSAYARQFLGRMEKPEVEYIKGVSPAIAVEQKVATRNPRSTVGTTTEIYDYLKLLFARVGRTYSPVSGEEVSKDTVADVVDFLSRQPEGTRFMVLSPLERAAGRTWKEELAILLQQGFTRVSLGGQVYFVEELLDDSKGIEWPEGAAVQLLVDRGVVKHGDESLLHRMADSVQTAFFEGRGDCLLQVFPAGAEPFGRAFSDRFERDGMAFEEPSVNLFSFNNPYGACKHCEGFGNVLGIDEDLVIPDKSLSVYQGAIAPWRGETFSAQWNAPLVAKAEAFGFPVHRPIAELSPEQRNLLWTGNAYFDGLNSFFSYLESKPHKIQYRVMLSRYRGRTTCPECHGSRLRKDAGYVKVAGKSIIELVLMPVGPLRDLFSGMALGEHDRQVAQRLLIEINNRLSYLCKVGLGYLTLNRLTNTLSGGEYQRIKLATSLGSALVGSMYILDEPSIGLHPRDTRNLIAVLEELRDVGNTVIVVEHEEEVMRAADQIIDIGPDAGLHGGELVFQGTLDELYGEVHTHTARYLSGKAGIAVPAHRRQWAEYVEVVGAREHNLRNLTVRFPLNALTVVTGVSGSGKSTLVKQVLYPALRKHFGHHGEAVGKYDQLQGPFAQLTQVEYVDQNPIGKSSRSNPVTYVKAYDGIRQLFAAQPLSAQRGYQAGHFSFNVEGGRCELCQGEGTVTVEMQFMADLHLPCESCKGQRFKDEILEVQYRGKNIAEVLGLSVAEGLDFFSEEPKIADRLRPLAKVGLGYVQLGQASSTLSGGEAQRVKLASFLVKGNLRQNDRLLFIFDEPTTGLHFHDVSLLLDSLQALIEAGHSVVVIEHNMEVAKCADWIIDMGPEGGLEGGQVCYAGTPEGLAALDNNHTAYFLKPRLL
jgi:excinuclease ABC subunit A